MAGLNDDIASRVMGELDQMTKTIDRTTARLDEQIRHMNTIESNIGEHVSTLIERSKGAADAPLNPETAEFLRREIRSIGIAAKSAREQNLHAIETAVAEALRLGLNQVDKRAGRAFDEAAAQFRTEVGMSVTVASETANQSLKQICIELNRKLQSMTSSAAKLQWMVMLGSSVIAAIVASVLTVYLIK